MDQSLETINSYLVDVFNQMLDIEETSLAQSKFNDLSIKEMHTIEAIGLHQEHTTTEVANKLNVTVGTLTVAVNALVKKGYVERLKHPTDRRIVVLGLTNRGRLLYRVHRRFHEELVKKTIQGLNEDEVKVLVKGLKNLYDFLHEIILTNMHEELE
ncbi:MarR family winged helix-turn-helix transcriptional regulator [Granulicatella seriolae]|uniref:MarR family transcriptional regulator n=1 Tax=Granulicatella seriolae TaxID=2967226 RepID=A0ABT1WKH1_9LACT|nr:MarR family transcriptional regulator [Granulicatella seriolae]